MCIKLFILHAFFNKGGKIILANDGVRNTGLNEMAECFTRKDNGLGGSKKEQAAKNSSLFGNVPYGLELSNFSDDFQGLRVLMNSFQGALQI